MGLPIPQYKEIVDLVKKGATLEAQEKIMELREFVIELQEDNLALRKRITELESELAAKVNLRFERNVYFKEDDNVPFCPYCYDSKNKMIHLVGPNDLVDGGLGWTCPECKSKYEERDGSDFKGFPGRRRNRN